jgi:hypothetical protein
VLSAVTDRDDPAQEVERLRRAIDEHLRHTHATVARAR